MPDERREIRIKRPASHNALDGSPFISRGGGERKRGVTELVPDSKDGCDNRHRPGGSLENEIGPKRECPRMVDENSREAAKECSPRRKPWAGLIFSTRERHPLIKPEFRSELFAYLGGIVREMHGTALIISGTVDHVHMLVRTRPAQAPAELACVVKTNSSRWVREKWSPNFGWQTGYGV